MLLSSYRRLALTKEEQSTSTTCAGCGAELLPGEVTSSNPTYGSICCKKNKVSLPPICTPCPEVTKLWHDADGVIGKTLRKFARAINNTLAFASQKVKRPNNLPGSSTWSPTVVIQGRVHHFIGSLAPNDNQSKQFVQTYINDPSMSECQQIDYRMGAISLPAGTSQAEKERVRECLEIMQKAITEHNPYVQDFVKVSAALHAALQMNLIDWLFCVLLVGVRTYGRQRDEGQDCHQRRRSSSAPSRRRSCYLAPSEVQRAQ